MPRTAGLRGRLPVKPEGERFAIRYLHEYLATPLPAPVYPVDVSGGIRDWGMCANGPDPTCTTHPDGVGDCTFAGRFHLEMSTAAAGHEPMPTETSNELVAEYLLYDHGQDIGANIADLLLTWYRAGKILAFAPVDHADRVAVDGAMQAFHGAYCGVDLCDDADELFQEGKPWTVDSGEQPDPSDGHCILKVGSDGTQFDKWVTWGAIQSSTLAWSEAALSEAWVLITEEDAKAANLDIAALRADIDALDGTGGNGSPEPAPVHPHANALIELADDVEAALRKARAYLTEHGII